MKKLALGLMVMSLILTGCNTETTQTEDQTTETVAEKEYDNTLDKKEVSVPGNETKIHDFYSKLVNEEQFILEQGMHDPGMNLTQYNLMGRDGERYINKMYQKSPSHEYEVRTIWTPEGIIVVNDTEELWEDMSDKSDQLTFADFSLILDRIEKATFATGDEEYQGNTYFAETFYEGEMGTTYLWEGDELKFILVNTPAGDAQMTIDRFELGSDESLFEVPGHYEEMTEEDVVE